MGNRGENAFAVGEILAALERSTREVGKSINPLRDTIDQDRLARARAALGATLEQIDALLGRGSR